MYYELKINEVKDTFSSYDHKRINVFIMFEQKKKFCVAHKKN